MRLYYYGSIILYSFSLYMFSKQGLLCLNDDFITMIKVVHSHFVLLTPSRRNETKEKIGEDK